MDLVASIAGEHDLYAALRARADASGVTRAEIDRLAGFTAGRASKILAPRPISGLSLDSLFALTAALGIKVQFVDDSDALAQINRSTKPRSNRHAMHASTVQFCISRREMRRRQKRGGAHSRKYMPADRASELGRKAALARWGKR